MAYDDKRAGGNTSRKGEGYDTLKWGSCKSPGVQAVVGGYLAGGGCSWDMSYGLPLFGPIPEGPSDEGVYKWQTANVGTAPGPHRSRPTRGSSGKD